MDVQGIVMAKLSDLIEVFASALSVPPTTVESYVKVLRKGGLLTTGGRGRGAPDISARDCATVLVGMMSGSPTHAIEMLSAFGGLRCGIAKSNSAGNENPVLNALGLPPSHCFLEAVSALVEVSITRNPCEIALELVSKTGVVPDNCIDPFGLGEIEISHQKKESFIKFGAQWFVPTGEKTAKSDSSQVWLVYWPSYQIEADGYKIPSVNFETKTSVKLYAIDQIGAMLSN